MRRASYLQRISGQRLTPAPVLKPVSPVLRRWEMTQFALPSQDRPSTGWLKNSVVAGDVEPHRSGSVESNASQVSGGSQESFAANMTAEVSQPTEKPTNAAPNANAPVAPGTSMHRPKSKRGPGLSSGRTGIDSFGGETFELRSGPPSVVAAKQREIKKSASFTDTTVLRANAELGTSAGEHASFPTGPAGSGGPAMRGERHSPALDAEKHVVTAPVLRTAAPMKPDSSAAASVHIGSIEVRVVPSSVPVQPPRVVKHSTSPGLLSRGFLSCFGLRQG
jgi:hypothetical protein